MNENGEELATLTRQQRVEVTERDIATLRWIGEQFAVGLDQLARVLGTQAGPGAVTPGKLSESSVRVWIRRMKAIGAIEQERPYLVLPSFVWLTAEGLKLAGLPYKPLRPALSTIQHLYWCNQARLYMAAQRPADTWVSDRQLRSEAAMQRRGRQPEKPDAHLVTQKGIIAIEVELTDKQQVRIVAIMRQRARQYYTIWYFASKEVQPRLEAARKELAPDLRDRVHIYSINQLQME
jgi:hypothetical protein